MVGHCTFLGGGCASLEQRSCHARFRVESVSWLHAPEGGDRPPPTEGDVAEGVTRNRADHGIETIASFEGSDSPPSLIATTLYKYVLPAVSGAS